jgi:hypothetical protein
MAFTRSRGTSSGNGSMNGSMCPEGFLARGIRRLQRQRIGGRRVHRYIQNQEEHHRRRNFEKEWISLLKRHGIEFNPERPFG